MDMENFLAVGSFPQISQSDYTWIQDFRKKNDIYYDLIDVHWTFVFPTLTIKAEDFIQEIRKQSTGVHSFDFRVKCAIRNNDRTNEYWHVLLVPDKGFSDIVRLHDQLYSGLLSTTERLDLDFIPHMGIGNTKDPEECKKMVDTVNEKDINIQGKVHQLNILHYHDGVLDTIETVKLI